MIVYFRVCVSVIKSIARGALTALGVAAYYLGLAGPLIRSRRASPKVLMYHALEEAENDFTRGLGVNTTPAQFQSHLRFLARHYRVVGLNQLIAEEPKVPTVAITFDDGYHCTYRNAFPILVRHQFIATFYLATNVIGDETVLWINELNWFLEKYRRHARRLVSEWLGVRVRTPLGLLKRLAVERYEAEGVGRILACLRAESSVDPGKLARRSRLHLDWDEVSEMSAAGMLFGNHTASHPPLAALSPEACSNEIGTAAERLSHLPGAADTLAYPFGSWNEAVRKAALNLGVRSLLEIDGVNAPLDPTSIARVNVTSISAAVLFARMEVVGPVTAWLKMRLRSMRSPTRSRRHPALDVETMTEHRP